MFALWLLTGGHGYPADGTPQQPERGYGMAARQAMVADRYMAVAAHPEAARVGSRILARGGTAMDAAVAVQLVLNLVEPQSSGIGGGAFLVYYDRSGGQLTTLDGRETAPSSVTPNHFLDERGEPLPWWERVTGGQSVGVPGTLLLLEEGHRRFGRLPWSDLVEPALRLARDGFEVSPRLAASVAEARDRGLDRFDATREYFLDDRGEPVAAGHWLRNPRFAETLEAIAASGSEPFYRGAIARDMVAAVNGSAPGHLTLEDLDGYRVIERPPVCAPFYRWRVCGMGPPSSGALTVGQILGLMERSGAPLQRRDTDWLHRFAEAGKLAFADRDRYIADADYVAVPVSGLLDPAYLDRRAALIDPLRAMPAAEAGSPPSRGQLLARVDSDSGERPGTSHISIVDSEGNALSMTTTIETGFGSRLMTGGFLLNNELTDFSAAPEADGHPVANRVEPGKRPRSSMAPTIVLDADGEPVLVIGSPGGSRIINYVAAATAAILQLGMDVQEAVGMPHAGSRNGPTELEQRPGVENEAEALRQLGHELRIADMNSGLHAIFRGADGRLRGGADPRREGLAVGD